MDIDPLKLIPQFKRTQFFIIRQEYIKILVGLLDMEVKVNASRDEVCIISRKGKGRAETLYCITIDRHNIELIEIKEKCPKRKVISQPFFAPALRYDVALPAVVKIARRISNKGILPKSPVIKKWVEKFYPSQSRLGWYGYPLSVKLKKRLQELEIMEFWEIAINSQEALKALRVFTPAMLREVSEFIHEVGLSFDLLTKDPPFNERSIDGQASK